MMKHYFDGLVASIQAKIDAEPDGPIARKRLTLETARIGARLFSGEGTVAWCGVLTPFDLLQAMGVDSCFVEFVGAVLASTGGVEPFLEEAEEAGYSTDSCSYHRAVTGAALQGLMPEPDFLVGTSSPCSGGLAVIENLARMFDKDLFVIQVPPFQSERSVAWLADQLRDMAAFVADHTGRPLEQQRLHAAVDATNRARALMVELYEIAQAVPSPARPRDLVNLGIVFALLLGTEDGVDVARIYRDELKARADAGVAGTPGESVRLLWMQNRIQFKQPLERMLADELGAAVVVDELNDILWEPIDPDRAFEGMARRMLSIPLVASAEERIANMRRLARLYRVDGVLNPCQWGCRQGAGIRGLVETGMGEIGVPVLNLEVDCVDTRSFAEGQLRTRLEAFVEMLEDSPPPTWEAR